jgi:hypothetical protein
LKEIWKDNSLVAQLVFGLVAAKASLMDNAMAGLMVVVMDGSCTVVLSDGSMVSN